MVFGANEAVFVQLIVPVAPTAGRVPQFQPIGTVKETKVVLVGMVSVNVAFPLAVAAGPLFVTICV